MKPWDYNTMFRAVSHPQPKGKHLLLHLATWHSVVNCPSEHWRLRSDEAHRTTSSAKSWDAIRRHTNTFQTAAASWNPEIHKYHRQDKGQPGKSPEPIVRLCAKKTDTALTSACCTSADSADMPQAFRRWEVVLAQQHIEQITNTNK